MTPEPEITQTPEQKKEFKTTNKKFSETNEEFIKWCVEAGIKPTTRQASKWRLKKGKAWKTSQPG